MGSSWKGPLSWRASGLTPHSRRITWNRLSRTTYRQLLSIFKEGDSIFSGQSVSVLSHPPSEGKTFDVQMEPPLFRLGICPLSLVLSCILRSDKSIIRTQSTRNQQHYLLRKLNMAVPSDSVNPI